MGNMRDNGPSPSPSTTTKRTLAEEQGEQQRTTRIHLEPLTKSNMQELMRINSLVLPVAYNSDTIYVQMVNVGMSYLAKSDDLVVGGVGCRLETIKWNASVPHDKCFPDLPNPQQPDDGRAHLRLYIMTLSVLAPYRSQGIGRMLMRQVMRDACRMEQEQALCIDQVYLHVQVSNEEAVRFYERLGFEKKRRLDKFYKRIENPDCYLMVLEE